MVEKQVRHLTNRYIQSVIFDHLYRRTMKKVVRMMLFQVIQESVDMVYFLEEDTIAASNSLLDAVILQEVRLVALEAVQLASFAQHCRSKHHLVQKLISQESSFQVIEDDDSL